MNGGLQYDRPDDRLKRDIGLLGASLLVLNGLVGAGIFLLPGELAQEIGSFSPWLFLIFGLLMFCIVYPFGELAGYFSASGGPVLYTAEAFGPFAAFQTGWLFYLSRVIAFAANVNILILYASSLWPVIADGSPRVATVVLIFVALTAVNVIGVKRAVRTLDALTLLKIAPLIGMLVYALAIGGDAGESTNWPEFSAVEGVALLVMYAYVGFESAVVPAGETENPRRNLPRSLSLTLAGVAMLYFVVQLAYVHTVGAREVEGAAMVEFGRVLAGPAGVVVVTLVAVFSIGGNLSAGMVSAPRLTFGLARAGALPVWFAQVNERFRTPANSILFLGGLACLLALTGSILWLAVASTLSRMLVYIASIAALPRVRTEAGVPPPAGPGALLLCYVVPVIGVALCVFVIAQASFEAWRGLLGLVAFGSILYVAARRFAPETAQIDIE